MYDQHIHKVLDDLLSGHTLKASWETQRYSVVMSRTEGRQSAEVAKAKALGTSLVRLKPGQKPQDLVDKPATVTMIVTLKGTPNASS